MTIEFLYKNATITLTPTLTYQQMEPGQTCSIIIRKNYNLELTFRNNVTFSLLFSDVTFTLCQSSNSVCHDAQQQPHSSKVCPQIISTICTMFSSDQCTLRPMSPEQANKPEASRCQLNTLRQCVSLLC